MSRRRALQPVSVIERAYKTEYIFKCGFCGKTFAVEVMSGNPAWELLRARKKAEKYLTECPECGLWVCGACYSAEENCCLGCSDVKFFRETSVADSVNFPSKGVKGEAPPQCTNGK